MTVFDSAREAFLRGDPIDWDEDTIRCALITNPPARNHGGAVSDDLRPPLVATDQRHCCGDCWQRGGLPHLPDCPLSADKDAWRAEPVCPARSPESGRPCALDDTAAHHDAEGGCHRSASVHSWSAVWPTTLEDRARWGGNVQTF